MNPMRKVSSHQTIQEIDRLAGLNDFKIINGCETDIPACSEAYENLRGGGEMSCCPERAIMLLNGRQVCARCIHKKFDEKDKELATKHESWQKSARAFVDKIDAKDKKFEEHAKRAAIVVCGYDEEFKTARERIKGLVAKLRETESAAGERIIQMGGLRRRIAELEAYVVEVGKTWRAINGNWND